MNSAETQPVLSIENLSVSFDTNDGRVDAVRQLSCRINPGECLGVVGESGSGKSQTFLAISALLASNGSVRGSAVFKGRELLGLSQKQMNEIRGDQLSMIFQDPLTSLTPHLKIGDQMREMLQAHRPLPGRAATDRCIEWLERVRIPDAPRRINQYPHELSGGMRQRVMIAMSMLCEPDLLIADEPTTALDVTIQAEILDLMHQLQAQHDTAIVLITHDMGVVARMCQQVVVMENGIAVESGAVDDIFYHPESDYTRKLLAAVPIIDPVATDGKQPDRPDDSAQRLLETTNIGVTFKTDGGLFRRSHSLAAVKDISLSLNRGETLGIVGESGSGKSTLARAILHLIPRKTGRISWMGSEIDSTSRKQLKALKKNMQIVFQDPVASLNPSITIGESVREPLRVLERGLTRAQMMLRVHEMLERVGLDDALINRFPHELSGGQNQRVGIARAMISRPELVICDEAVSALDVSVQAQVLELLRSLQQELGISYIFISHDLAVVWEISDQILVMYAGCAMEFAPKNALFSSPQHPYTRQLISAVPLPDPAREVTRTRLLFRQDLPDPAHPQASLRFMPEKLKQDPGYQPKLNRYAERHLVAEHEPLESLLADN